MSVYWRHSILRVLQEESIVQSRVDCLEKKITKNHNNHQVCINESDKANENRQRRTEHVVCQERDDCREKS